MSYVQRAMLAVMSLGVMAHACAQYSQAEGLHNQLITDVEQAKALIAEVESTRVQAQEKYAQEEQRCQAEFFVNRCIEKARQRRLEVTRPLEEVELEARRYIRQDRALEREANVARRRAEAEQRTREVEAAGTVPFKERRNDPPPVPTPPKLRAKPAEPTEEEKRAEAMERAENEAAYARKIERAKARRESLAKRRAEKDARMDASIEGAEN